MAFTAHIARHCKDMISENQYHHLFIKEMFLYSLSALAFSVTEAANNRENCSI